MVYITVLPGRVWLLSPGSAGVTLGEASGTAQEADRHNIVSGPSVIRGFDLRFTNGDHHLREIGIITPDDGRIEAFYSDKNGDAPFDWTVQWATLGPDDIISSRESNVK